MYPFFTHSLSLITCDVFRGPTSPAINWKDLFRPQHHDCSFSFRLHLLVLVNGHPTPTPTPMTIHGLRGGGICSDNNPAPTLPVNTQSIAAV